MLKKFWMKCVPPCTTVEINMVEESGLSLIFLHPGLDSPHHMHMGQRRYLGGVPQNLQLLLCLGHPALCHVMMQEGPVCWELGHAIKSCRSGHLAWISVGPLKEQERRRGRGGTSEAGGHLVHEHHLVNLVSLAHLLWGGYMSHNDPIVLWQPRHVDHASASGHVNAAVIVRFKDAKAPMEVRLLTEDRSHVAGVPFTHTLADRLRFQFLGRIFTWSPPPCRSTTAPSGTSWRDLSLDTKRCRFSANRDTGTLKESMSCFGTTKNPFDLSLNSVCLFTLVWGGQHPGVKTALSLTLHFSLTLSLS